MDKFVFKRRRTEQQKVVAGVLDKTMVTRTPAGVPRFSCARPGQRKISKQKRRWSSSRSKRKRRRTRKGAGMATVGMDTGHDAIANTDISQRPGDALAPHEKNVPFKANG